VSLQIGTVKEIERENWKPDETPVTVTDLQARI